MRICREDEEKDCGFQDAFPEARGFSHVPEAGDFVVGKNECFFFFLLPFYLFFLHIKCLILGCAYFVSLVLVVHCFQMTMCVGRNCVF